MRTSKGLDWYECSGEGVIWVSGVIEIIKRQCDTAQWQQTLHGLDRTSCHFDAAKGMIAL
jgi:hypothetical protein